MSIQSELNRIVSNIENAYATIKQKGGTVPSSKTSANLASSIATISTESIPSGAIIMWSGSSTNIPSGWALCNGQNGTPNLVNKFIRGGTSSGATGGADTVTLSTANMPSHNHTISAYSVGQGTNSSNKNIVIATGSGSSGGSVSVDNIVTTASTRIVPTSNTVNNASLSITTKNTGSGQSFSILPTYYTLCYIMKL